MNLNGIDATLNQLVQQLPKGLAQRERGCPLFDPLSNELTSASPLYNEREVILREALDLGAIENHLRKVAESYEIGSTRATWKGSCATRATAPLTWARPSAT